MADENRGGLTLPGAPNKTPGLPENFQMVVFDGFEGLNTKPSRTAIKDQEMSYCNNWVPLGRNDLRTLYDVGTSIYTSPTGLTITHFAFANISSNPISMVFLSDGSVVQVQTVTMATTQVAPAGTILTPTNQIGNTQFGSQGVVFDVQQSNGYFFWDGTALYQAGSVGPTITISNGGNHYISPPSIQAIGGTGNGATFAATVTSTGAVATINVVTSGSGYIATDGSLYLAFSGGSGGTSATAIATLTSGGVGAVTMQTQGNGYTASSKVTFVGGGGFGAVGTTTVGTSGGITAVTITSNGAGYLSAPTVVFTDTLNPVAQATVALMPFGVQGTGAETFVNHVWLCNGSQILFTAPSSVQDFGTPNGGGSFKSTDSFLRQQFVGLKQSNGFLYMFGDSSINYISGVQTTGTPSTTTFTNQNVDPQIGTQWPETIQTFSRSLVFANSFGVHALYGGAVKKVSDNLDGIFTTVPLANFPIRPHGAVAIIFGVHTYCLLMPIVDPITNVQRNALLMWDGNKWYSGSQSINLIRIASQEINSVLTAYGTDGTGIYPLFQTPSTAITKTVQSKLWDKPHYMALKQAQRVYAIVQSDTGLAANLNITVESEQANQLVTENTVFGVIWKNNAGNVVPWTNQSGAAASWLAPGVFVSGPFQCQVPGFVMGMTINTTSPDFSLVSVSLAEIVHDLRI